MADWLRPVFGRARVPGASNSDRPGSFSIDESIATESEDGNASFSNTPRLRPTSRVSSYIGIRPTTPPIPQTPDTFSSFRNPESVYRMFISSEISSPCSTDVLHSGILHDLRPFCSSTCKFMRIFANCSTSRQAFT